MTHPPEPQPGEIWQSRQYGWRARIREDGRFVIIHPARDVGWVLGERQYWDPHVVIGTIPAPRNRSFPNTWHGEFDLDGELFEPDVFAQIERFVAAHKKAAALPRAASDPHRQTSRSGKGKGRGQRHPAKPGRW